MTEIRVRPKQFLLTLILFGLLLWYVASRNKCSSDLEYNDSLPLIYAVTPTYARPTQKAELTRLSHLITLVPNIHWILVEDANQPSKLVQSLLELSKLITRSTLLNIKTPDEYKLNKKDQNWMKPRGVEQRNLAIQWIRENSNKDKHSIVYFMDDDNTYSVELFSEMMKIEPGKVGVWPVGLVGGLMVEKPILNEQNIVTGFNSVWRPERPFPIDMAGFAISTNLLIKYPKASFSFEVDRGFQESEILRFVTLKNELQPLANLCQDVLVWHTRTEKPKLVGEDKLLKEKKKPSNDGMEV
ncbi:galactosylgalactosylxylosylprotein 3-beta-glucuronosyltransferase I [Condylostylus longicornis]|uniref:galactosylgalactosylxylosylprotein 3-beta-glucuronosyltransferase I n=1 Tax=Condylostylus longicornis TaxID=2530218 RepID=UPI00244E50CC|nr:galactosylgalactosylxylosylprotein 3-beta-glucuronosyltransferase I [Condylostylus longicornis]